MPQFVFSNFINTTLSAAATSTDTSLSVTSATNFPTLETGQQLPITLINAATQTVYEIIYVTAISGTTLTVLRGQEGTVAQAWSIGDLVKGCITAATVSPSPGTHSPVSSETLPVTLGTLKVTPGTLTEDITLTTPNAGDPGSETTIYGSASAYTTTVSTGVTSGSPYIEMPYGSPVYSYVIPASSPGAGIRLDFDGTNYRATTFGTTIVAPATANNEAVAKGQVLNVAPVGASASADNTTVTATTPTFVAPCNGNLLIWVFAGSAQTGGISSTTTASLGTLTSIAEAADMPNTMAQYLLPMTAGQSTTISSTTTISAANYISAAITTAFQPTP